MSTEIVVPILYILHNIDTVYEKHCKVMNRSIKKRKGNVLLKSLLSPISAKIDLLVGEKPDPWAAVPINTFMGGLVGEGGRGSTWMALGGGSII